MPKEKEVALLDQKRKYTQAEYLEMERKAPYKRDYYKGEIFAPAGASRTHNIITLNIASFLNTNLRGKGCRPYSSDMRVHIPISTLYTYPDIIVTCGKEDFLDREFDTLLNPIFIVEVFSLSTEDYDLGKKFKLYRSIPSLKEFWTVSSCEHRLVKHVRNEDGSSWTLTETASVADSVTIASLSLEMSLNEIYEGVEF